MKNRGKTAIMCATGVGSIMNNPETVETLREEYGIEFCNPPTVYESREVLPRPYISEQRRLKTSSTKRTSNKDVLKRRKRNKYKKLIGDMYADLETLLDPGKVLEKILNNLYPQFGDYRIYHCKQTQSDPKLLQKQKRRKKNKNRKTHRK